MAERWKNPVIVWLVAVVAVLLVTAGGMPTALADVIVVQGDNSVTT